MIVTGVLWLSTATGALADPAPEYFNLPTGYNASSGIAPASDGTVWFAANPSTPNPALGRLDTAQAVAGTANGMTTYPTPLLSSSCCANAVRSVAYDAARNRVWFVQNDGIIGWGNPPLMQAGSSNGIQARLLSTATMSGPYSPSLLRSRPTAWPGSPRTAPTTPRPTLAGASRRSAAGWASPSRRTSRCRAAR
jgi:hypothetical protein